ncbi:transporter substrate-binding domain-containing protein [Paraburkholderia aspalathi]|uniref:transporter substrate-binding domain-containing protein n=1 Tax=Paraburkholderia aspalathi TaxID=1324617 RepID=UPI001B0E2EBF|nr:transporter substrate-binding domain-containing protein [Paraburkholderia aspalathi]CAE6738262.1 putative ABC transporter extracellular-binding protein YckB [Paraburkholderia aspalathi]
MLRSIIPFFVVIFAFAFVVPASAACDPGAAGSRYPLYAQKVVKIAASPTQPPFAFVDAGNPNELVGLEVDMIKEVMRCAGLRYEFIEGAWAGLMPAVFAGSADVMIGDVNYREDRSQRADFILYLLAAQSVVVQKGNPRGVTKDADLCGTSGTATMGSSSAHKIEQLNQTCVANGKPLIVFQPAADADAAYRLVANGRTDFAMDEAASVSARLRTKPDYQLAYSVSTGLKGGFIVAKGNKEMLDIVYDGLKAEEKNGTLLRLLTKYGLPENLLIPVEVQR